MELQDYETKLIKIYDYVCENFHFLYPLCMRHSPNSSPEFTDEEVLTIYLFGLEWLKLSKIKQIHSFATSFLKDWFPKLGSYQAFNARINRLSGAMREFTAVILEKEMPEGCISCQCLVDSMPIITCSGKRKGKVAPCITDKTYCASKGIWYYGVKLHCLAFRRTNKLPYAESIIVTPASICDLTIFREYWAEKKECAFWGDKIYFTEELNEKMKLSGSEILAPVKQKKGMPEVLKQRDKAADDLYSTAVSKVRQPIEALFSWLIEKVDLQNASHVRSEQGLFAHIFGKLSAAFLHYKFNP